MTDRQPGAMAQDCPCEQAECDLHGRCVECVEVHRKGGHHVPECMQPMLRSAIAELAAKVEYKVEEGRPGQDD